ncbi:MAG: threonine ammonia-lyase [Pseudomonadota bacterium]|nr:threonine ammonia-lyase [Pseudomonadota bacterium]
MPPAESNNSDAPLGLEDVRSAADILRGHIVDTPCIRSATLSDITGADVTLKLENLQFTGSFKDRGALVRLTALSEQERARGVIAMSAGNHAQSVAYHAQRLGIPAVIVMPQFTPNIKVERTRAFGAQVELHGESLSEAGVRAAQIAEQRDLVFVHPYDDLAVIAGQGTIALEMLTEAPELEVLVIPVGGGGLISGMATAAKGLRPDLEIVGVETALYPSMARALEERPAEFGPYTIAEGIAVKQPGHYTLDVIRRLVDRILLVDEASIEEAVLLLLEVEKTVAEGAGAVPLAALRSYPEQFKGRRVGLVISGGNVDLPVLSSIIQRGLVRSGRLARLTLEIRDVPGELAKTADLIGRLGANIVQVLHQRIFTELPLQNTEVQFVLQTRGPSHLKELLATLRKAGYPPRVEGGMVQ